MMISMIAAAIMASVRMTARCPPERAHLACAKIPLPATSPAKRRRLVRLARIDRLEWREAQLLDFLRTARTETIVLRDERIVEVEPAIHIGPTVISRDFLGGLVIRTRLQGEGWDRALLVIAHVRTADGSEANAAVPLQPPQVQRSQDIELACPANIVPASVTWTVIDL